MNRKIVIIGLVIFLGLCVGLNYLVIKPNAVVFEKKQMCDKFTGYIAYKNNQKGRYLYLVNTPEEVNKLRLDSLYESEAFNKPRLGGHIRHIVSTVDALYEASRIGDKIEKLPNSNKCYLFTDSSIFKFNCYKISDEEKPEIGKIEEWRPNETGVWKRANNKL
jgi:hypothetical protein